METIFDLTDILDLPPISGFQLSEGRGEHLRGFWPVSKFRLAIYIDIKPPKIDGGWGSENPPNVILCL